MNEESRWSGIPASEIDDKEARLKLSDRVAVITGGGSGIGRAIALRFAHEGAHVIVAGRTRAALDETLAAMKTSRHKGRAISTDVANSASVKALFAEVDRDFGRLDILVNNAGIGVEDFDQFNATVEARGPRSPAASRCRLSGD